MKPWLKISRMADHVTDSTTEGRFHKTEQIVLPSICMVYCSNFPRLVLIHYCYQPIQKNGIGLNKA